MLRRSTEADAAKADEISKIATDMKANAEKDVDTVAQKAEQWRGDGRRHRPEDRRRLRGTPWTMAR
ncbi:hypothetical protein [Actinospica sp.]|uniref:hypothetical protein n=1 Tax=Actinospica sp. TaxID=1872142 RepID=UPI002C537E2C|nr:hypothetical protein [Actinospica sp.]HWG25168.1 hypothetical protein [Actinospica sp.]